MGLTLKNANGTQNVRFQCNLLNRKPIFRKCHKYLSKVFFICAQSFRSHHLDNMLKYKQRPQSIHCIGILKTLEDEKCSFESYVNRHEIQNRPLKGLNSGVVICLYCSLRFSIYDQHFYSANLHVDTIKCALHQVLRLPNRQFQLLINARRG